MDATEHLLLYDETSLSFLKRCQQRVRSILSAELGLSVQRKRFLYRNYFYPFQVVVFEDNTKHGFFDPIGYRLGINKRLMYQASEEVIDDIIRHELAHLFTYIEYGSNVCAHGKEFQQVCRNFNWPENVSPATLKLPQITEDPTNDRGQKVIAKVQKILRLAASSNLNESKLATAKANQLLLEYNLSAVDIDENSAGPCADQTTLKVVARAKRTNAKLRAIYDILTHFFVRPVLNSGRGQVYLEVVGRRTNVEMAEYVANFLDHELEQIWKKSQKENPAMKGARAKNSFFYGLSQGYTQKIKSARPSGVASSRQLIVLKQDLEARVQKVYGRLRSSSSETKLDEAAKSVGETQGKNLSIRPGIKNQREKTPLLSSPLRWSRK